MRRNELSFLLESLNKTLQDRDWYGIGIGNNCAVN